MPNAAGGFYAFGSYRLNATSRVLTRSDATVALAPKTFDLLVLLVESGGRLLSKRELMDALWHDTAVEEANLSFQISTLRKALGVEGQVWIEAVPKHGYRFKAPVEQHPEIENAAAGAGERSNLAVGSAPVEVAREMDRRTRSPLRRRWLIAATVGGFAIAVSFGTWRLLPKQRKESPTAALTAFPATTYHGRETNPSFSPDGSQIAFAWDAGAGGDFDIYVKVVGDNKALRLTSDRRPEFSPAWSPDGRHIAFCRDGQSGSEIVLVSALGGPEQILATLPKQADADGGSGPLSWFPGVRYPNAHLAWFPDGAFLAVVARTRQDSPNTIFLLSIEERSLRPLTSPPDGGWGDDSPAVSSDGRRLAFTRSLAPYTEPSYLYFEPLSDQKLAAGECRRVTEQETMVAGLAWTADNNRIVFCSRRALWTVGLRHNIPEQVALRGYDPRFPALSAKGDRLAFVEWIDDRDIWRIGGPAGLEKSNGTSTVGTRLISSTRLDTNPQYSPDGARIAFTSTRSGTFQIWICASDGSNPIQLTAFVGAEAGTPRWSPDGKYIAFDLLQPGNGGIGDVYVMAAQGGPVRRMTPEPSNEDMPSWSHDGKWIYFESDRSGVFEIWKVPFTGGPAIQVTDNGGADAFESQDGNFVYYAKWHQRGLWRKPVQRGGQETIVANIGSPYLWGLYDKGACAVDVAPAAAASIQCLDFESGQIKTIGTLPNDKPINAGGPSLSISRDGRFILYVGKDQQESDIMLVNNFR